MATLLLRNSRLPIGLSGTGRRFYQLNINKVKKGQTLSLRGKLWLVSDYSHHTQGRGGAHYKVELRELLSGSKSFERFNAGATLEGVELEEQQMRFLYHAGDVHVLNPETYEEVELPASIIAGGSKVIPFLREDDLLTIQSYHGKPVLVKPPSQGIFTVQDTAAPPSTVTNDSKGTTYKAATLENDCRLQVPAFIKPGDRILVDILEQKYMNRA